MKVYAVIGSNSFTGSHVVDALLDDPDNQVVGVSRSPEYKDYLLPYKKRQCSNFSFHQLDLVKCFNEVAELLDVMKPQVVINVAALSEVALSFKRPVEYFDVNTTAVVKLCEHLRTRPYLERYVHVSSAEIFGDCAAPLNEECHFNPSTPYAVSKAAADFYLNTLLSGVGFPVTIARSTNVYGGHQQLFKIIPRTIIYLMLGKTLELHGGGQAIKSFIHVRDVVQGLIRAIESGNPGSYHFTMNSNQTIADIVRHICTYMGHDFEEATRVVSERSDQDARYWLDASKAERELGWTPKVSFEDGVAEVVQWIKGNWDTIQQDPLEYIHKV